MSTEDHSTRFFGYILAGTGEEKADEERIRKYAAALGGYHCRVFTDAAGWPRKRMDQRPYGNHLLLELGRSDTLIVCRMEVLGRSAWDMIATMKQLVLRGVRLIVLDFDGAGIEFDGENGELLIGMFAHIGDLFRKQHAEATREALRWRRDKGLPYHGRPRFGYRRIKRRDGSRTRVERYERHERECRLLEEIYGRHLKGETIGDIHRDFVRRKERRAEGGEWTYDAVRKACTFVERQWERGEFV